MSYVDHKADFAPAGGIQELSFDEIEEVAGGIWPYLAVAGAVWLASELWHHHG